MGAGSERGCSNLLLFLTNLEKKSQTLFSDCHIYSDTNMGVFKDTNVASYVPTKSKTLIDVPAICENLCLTDTTINCISALHDMTSQICYLSEQPFSVYPPGDLVPMPGWTMLQRYVKVWGTILVKRSGMGTVKAKL